MSLFSKNPIEKPTYPTWAVLEPGNLPPTPFPDHALGSIIPHSAVYQPTTGYLIPQDYRVLEQIFEKTGLKPLTAEDCGATAFIRSVEAHELKGQLSKILDVRTHTTSTGKLTIQTQTVFTRTLFNPARIFEELKENPAVLQELTARLDAEGLADMIVGLKTSTDAQLTYTHENSNGTDAHVGIPIDEIIAALGGPPIPIDLEASAAVKLEKIRKYVAEHQAKGERVFALQYRRIMKVKRWREQKHAEMGPLESFQIGLFSTGDYESDHDDDDMILCPFEEVPEGMMTF